MPETVSLKEAIRQALEADDAREKTPPIEPIEEANEPVDMTFVEQAGQLIPWEGK